MFDIGFSEILLILGLGLVVLGPDRLPGAVRTVLYWFRRARASFDDARIHIERELNTDEMKNNMLNYNTELEKFNHSIKESSDIHAINESISKTFSTPKLKTKKKVVKNIKKQSPAKPKKSTKKLATKITKTKIL